MKYLPPEKAVTITILGSTAGGREGVAIRLQKSKSTFGSIDLERCRHLRTTMGSHS